MKPEYIALKMALLVEMFGNTPIQQTGKNDFELTSAMLTEMVVFPNEWVWENGYELFNQN